MLLRSLALNKKDQKKIVEAMGGHVLPDGSFALPMTMEVMNAVLVSQPWPKTRKRGSGGQKSRSRK